jgi:hypothetical protein
LNTVDFNMILGRPASHVSGVLTARELLDEMDRQNIEKCLVTHLGASVCDTETGNRLLLQQIQAAGGDRGRLVPVPVLNWNLPAGSLDWDSWASCGCRGIGVCPSFYGASESPEAVDKTLAVLSERGWFLHVLLRPFCGASQQTGTIGDAVSLAARRTDVPVMLVCPRRSEFAALCSALRSSPNLCADVGNLSTGTHVRDLVARGFANRLVCGSGFGVCCSTPSRDVVLYSPIPEAAREAILRGNALRLLGCATAEPSGG